MTSNTDFNQLVSMDVIARAQVGDHSAFKVIYQNYSKIVYGIALRIVKHDDIAQEVLQESFINVFKYINQYKGEIVFMAWLKRIVVNQAINKLKSLNRFKQDIPDYEVQDVSSIFDENWLAAKQDIELLLSKLSDDYRTVFVLHEVEGYKHSEIAELTGKSISYSKVTLMRCYQQLKLLAEQ